MWKCSGVTIISSPFVTSYHAGNRYCFEEKWILSHLFSRTILIDLPPTPPWACWYQVWKGTASSSVCSIRVLHLPLGDPPFPFPHDPLWNPGDPMTPLLLIARGIQRFLWNLLRLLPRALHVRLSVLSRGNPRLPWGYFRVLLGSLCLRVDPVILAARRHLLIQLVLEVQGGRIATRKIPSSEMKKKNYSSNLEMKQGSANGNWNIEFKNTNELNLTPVMCLKIANGHIMMAQNPPCWKANYTLGHPKQMSQCFSCSSAWWILYHVIVAVKGPLGKVHWMVTLYGFT